MSITRQTVVYATDDNFWEHTYTSLYSLLANNRDIPFDIRILAEQLSERQWDDIRFLDRVHQDVDVTLLPIDPRALNNAPIMLKSFSLATYYRLLLGSLLPGSIGRVLYLDGDTIVRRPLHDLFTLDLDGWVLGAVAHQNETQEIPHAVRLGLPDGARNFNAGVLLINLDEWRKRGIEQHCLEYIETNADNPSALVFQDQDTLNAVLVGQWKNLDTSFNYSEWTLPPREFHLAARGDGPHIAHFAGPIKPWHGGSLHPCESDYWAYRQRTPCARHPELIRSKIVAGVRILRHCLISTVRQLPGGASVLRAGRSVIQRRSNVIQRERLH
jgi:lipopolysaccharide biosynthesis glycosyltransferase